MDFADDIEISLGPVNQNYLALLFLIYIYKKDVFD
jgi:hypothetical protein